jgi:uncharacterized protein
VTIFYLHGFASGSKSTKATYLSERMGSAEVSFRCPDFNAPDFRTLTMTRMLDQLTAEVQSVTSLPVVLIGSSLGGALAILAAERLAARVDRLILFAPAVMFAKPGHHLLPPERVEEWRHRGALPFFHYGYNEERLLDFSFYEDTIQYDAFDAVVRQPTLIFQGLHDRSVPFQTVEQFARTRPNVTLSLLEDDHQLVASLPRMWIDIAEFIGLTP